MFGLDERIAHLSNGASVALVVAVAVVLGLRHATDPDHLAAVTTLVASGRERTRRLAARLGLAWGLGHATTLFAFGLPIVLFRAYLPARVQEAAETAVGVLIAGLAVWLLVRWRRGMLHVHRHEHGDHTHVHAHAHATPPIPSNTMSRARRTSSSGSRQRPSSSGDGSNTMSLGLRASRDRASHHTHGHTIRARSPLQAYAIGLLHGIGGSAGVGVLLLAGIQDRLLAVAALGLFAGCTAISMALLSTGFGATLSSVAVRRSFHRVAPALACGSLVFGVWYALGALDVAPYVF
jgi:ABC-type nickel/cobalt efflux system permease component RcnA